MVGWHIHQANLVPCSRPPALLHSRPCSPSSSPLGWGSLPHLPRTGGGELHIPLSPQPESRPAALRCGAGTVGPNQEGPGAPCPAVFCGDEVLQWLQHQAKGQGTGTAEKKQLPSSSSQPFLPKFLNIVQLNSSITVLLSFLSKK